MSYWYNFPGGVGNAPRHEGVYLLSETSSENGIIYVGRADNLYERLSDHPDPQNSCLQEKIISYFAYEVTSDSERRESELIQKYNPRCNNTD